MLWAMIWQVNPYTYNLLMFNMASFVGLGQVSLLKKCLFSLAIKGSNIRVRTGIL